MRVKVEQVGNGLHHDEVVVRVQTRDGAAHLAVDRASLHDATLEIGWPVGEEKGFFLIELPRETFQGFWRVWVNFNILEESTTGKVFA